MRLARMCAEKASTPSITFAVERPKPLLKRSTTQSITHQVCRLLSVLTLTVHLHSLVHDLDLNSVQEVLTRGKSWTDNWNTHSLRAAHSHNLTNTHLEIVRLTLITMALLTSDCYRTFSPISRHWKCLSTNLSHYFTPLKDMY